jgi:hypothetical protein
MCDRHRAWVKQGGQLGLLAGGKDVTGAGAAAAQLNRCYRQWYDGGKGPIGNENYTLANSPNDTPEMISAMTFVCELYSV